MIGPMLHSFEKLDGREVWVNLTHVRHFEQAQQGGTLLFFDQDHHVHVRDEVSMVYDKLQAAYWNRAVGR